MKYNPAKFFSAFFLGKLLITIVGAYLGIVSEGFLSSTIGQGALVIISIILTVVITIILLKIDLGKITEKILKRKITLPQ
jgi:membrane protein DedA with SNARE-associated domain